MIKLMKYTKVVLNNMKEQVMRKILSTAEILIRPLIVFNIEMVFWVVVKIAEIYQYPKKRVKNNHTKKIDFIFLNTHQSAQIMASASLKMVRNMANEKKQIHMMIYENVYNKVLELDGEPIHGFFK